MRSVASTYADSSMSIRMVFCSASAESASTRRLAAASASPIASPKCVSLSATFACKQLAVFTNDVLRFVGALHSLAQNCGGDCEPFGAEPPDDRDEIVEALACDEAPRAKTQAVRRRDAVQVWIAGSGQE